MLKGDVVPKVSYSALYHTLQPTQTEIDDMKEESMNLRIALLTGFEVSFGKLETNEL
jgi:hypothetical protein